MRENDIKIAKPMGLTVPFKNSPVDIIIPYHGQYEKVGRLIESILYLTKSNPFTLCLIDDFSANINFGQELKRKIDLNLIRNEKHLGFGASIEKGIRSTQSPWVVILHSDCVIQQKDWLLQLGQCMLELKGRNVKLISARTNLPGEGTEKCLYAKNFTEKSPHVILESGFVPFYCAIAHRNLFAQIGFPKHYYPAMYEDEEFAFRMRKNGFKQGVCGTSWIHHDGGATIEELCKTDFRMADFINANHEKCIKDIQRF